MYDNAGEHFQPGQDATSSPVTRHLAQSRAVLFVFDPTQDPRFRAACRGAEPRESKQRASRLSRQETILNEAASRIRRHTGLSHGSKFDRPLVVVLSKLDEWSHLLDGEDGDPWRAQGNLTGLDLDRIGKRSGRLRDVLTQYCPETVVAAETFASDITYMCVSALGNRIEHDPNTGLASIRPGDIEPVWVTGPLLYAVSRARRHLFPGWFDGRGLQQRVEILPGRHPRRPRNSRDWAVNRIEVELA